MAAIGRFVLRGQEHFCLIRPRGEALALETLFLAEDVRSQAEIEEAVEDTQVKDAELELARQVIGSLVSNFDPGELESGYRRDLRAMLEAKLAGEEIARPEPTERRRRSSTSWRRSARASRTPRSRRRPRSAARQRRRRPARRRRPPPESRL